jgi:hypothetical protein
MPPRIASVLKEGISQDELRRVDKEHLTWALQSTAGKVTDGKARTNHGEREKENTA